MFPDKINTFVDLFGGGFNVGINVKADYIIYNDICEQVVGFLRYLQGSNIEEVLHKYLSNRQNKPQQYIARH